MRKATTEMLAQGQTLMHRKSLKMITNDSLVIVEYTMGELK